MLLWFPLRLVVCIGFFGSFAPSAAGVALSAPPTEGAKDRPTSTELSTSTSLAGERNRLRRAGIVRRDEFENVRRGFTPVTRQHGVSAKTLFQTHARLKEAESPQSQLQERPSPQPSAWAQDDRDEDASTSSSSDSEDDSTTVVTSLSSHSSLDADWHDPDGISRVDSFSSMNDPLRSRTAGGSHGFISPRRRESSSGISVGSHSPSHSRGGVPANQPAPPLEPAMVPVCAQCGNWGPGVVAGSVSAALGLVTAGLEGGIVGAAGGYALNRVLTDDIGQSRPPTASGTVGGVEALCSLCRGGREFGSELGAASRRVGEMVQQVAQEVIEDAWVLEGAAGAWAPGEQDAAGEAWETRIIPRRSRVRYYEDGVEIDPDDDAGSFGNVDGRVLSSPQNHDTTIQRAGPHERDNMLRGYVDTWKTATSGGRRTGIVCLCALCGYGGGGGVLLRPDDITVPWPDIAGPPPPHRGPPSPDNVVEEQSCPGCRGDRNQQNLLMTQERGGTCDDCRSHPLESRVRDAFRRVQDSRRGLQTLLVTSFTNEFANELAEQHRRALAEFQAAVGEFRAAVDELQAAVDGFQEAGWERASGEAGRAEEEDGGVWV